MNHYLMLGMFRRLVVGGLFVLLLCIATVGSPASVARAACVALPSNNGSVTFTVDIPSTGAYRFWARMYSPSVGSNAVKLQVDTAYCNITIGNSSGMPARQFTWVDYQNGDTTSKIDMTLSSGNHAITLAGLDAGVGVDKILLTSDTGCVPVDDGANCAAAVTSSPAASTPVSGAAVPSPPSYSSKTTAKNSQINGILAWLEQPLNAIGIASVVALVSAGIWLLWRRPALWHRFLHSAAPPAPPPLTGPESPVAYPDQKRPKL